jgi:hypothetical protein
VIHEETIQKLLELKLRAMAQAVRELLASAPGDKLSFEEQLGLLVDREWSERRNQQLARRLKRPSSA